MPTAQRRRFGTARLSRRGWLAAALTLAAAGCDERVPARRPEMPGHVARGRGDGRPFAKFELMSPAAMVTVRAADLSGDLYRVTTPVGGGVRPVVGSRGGLVRAALRPTGTAGPDSVEITLQAGVRWALLLRAGAGEVLLDLAAAALTGVAVVGGAGRLRLFLPRPAAVAGRVWLAAGIGRAEVWVPAGVPVVVRGAVRAARPGLGGPGYVVEARAALGELLLH